MTIREKLKKISQKFPNTPGVYFWMGADKKPLYIGRAGSLKKRIASYFLTKDPRIGEMVGLAKNLKFQKTETLLEAIILEANLIRKYWPKYNVKEKDNRSFLYIVVTNDEFPRLLTIRARELEKYSVTEKSAKAIFGPYQSYHLLRATLEIVRKIFPYTTDRENTGKPCFHYQIGLCPGVCIGQADAKAYAEVIRNLILFFRGDKKRLLARLKKQNPEAIRSLQHVSDVSLLSGSDGLMKQGGQFAVGRIEGYDISHLSGKEPVGSMVVFENGEKDTSQYRIFKIRGDVSEAATPRGSKGEVRSYDDLSMLREVLERRLRHKEWPLPDVFFIDGGLLQVKAARDTIARHQIFVPVVGLNKSGQHAASAGQGDKLVALNAKKTGKELLLGSKKLFQEVRNEAHRFAIGFNRRQTRRGSFGWRHGLHK
jgi:excinuclease ABC subunit C